jgi:hypothetical protein
VRLFYSALDEVAISYDDRSFKIIEYVRLGLQQSFKYYKLEETLITFEDNANYSIDAKLIFEPPQFNRKLLHHIYNTNNAILEKLEKNMRLAPHEISDLENLAASYLICYLNGFDEALPKLDYIKPYLKRQSRNLYQSYKDTMRILRKVKYS